MTEFNFSKDSIVSILTGKFAGLTATVLKTVADKNGVTRIQVSLNSQIFSYLPQSLGSVAAVSGSATVQPSADAGAATSSNTTAESSSKTLAG